jgi:hypothetical protein
MIWATIFWGNAHLVTFKRQNSRSFTGMIFTGLPIGKERIGALEFA